jgi:alpha-L-fucosidase 2
MPLLPIRTRPRFVLDLLPALPSAWPNGIVTGLRARDGFEISLEWTDGKLKSAKVQSLLGRSLHVRCGDRSVKLDTQAGQTYWFDDKMSHREHREHRGE